MEPVLDTGVVVDCVLADGHERTLADDVLDGLTRPLKELRGFKKVSLQPGERATVELPVGPASLSFYDIDMNYVVEPGEFTVMVGTSSRDVDLTSVTLHVDQ